MFVDCDFHVSRVNMGDRSGQIMRIDSDDDVALPQEEKFDANVLSLPLNPEMPEVLEDVKVENPDNSLCSIGDGGVNSFSGANLPGFKSDQLDDGDDDDGFLDHIVLKERQRMLLLSRCHFCLS